MKTENNSLSEFLYRWEQYQKKKGILVITSERLQIADIIAASKEADAAIFSIDTKESCPLGTKPKMSEPKMSDYYAKRLKRAVADREEAEKIGTLLESQIKKLGEQLKETEGTIIEKLSNLDECTDADLIIETAKEAKELTATLCEKIEGVQYWQNQQLPDVIRNCDTRIHEAETLLYYWLEKEKNNSEL